MPHCAASECHASNCSLRYAKTKNNLSLLLDLLLQVVLASIFVLFVFFFCLAALLCVILLDFRAQWTLLENILYSTNIKSEYQEQEQSAFYLIIKVNKLLQNLIDNKPGEFHMTKQQQQLLLLSYLFLSYYYMLWHYAWVLIMFRILSGLSSAGAGAGAVGKC